MKKVFISAALFAAVCAFSSCANHDEFREELDVIEKYENAAQTNRQIFDEKETGEVEFWSACKSLISVHKDFDYFRAVLTPEMLAKMDNETYTVDDAVSIIYLWWENDNTFDVMVEWWAWDIFFELLPERYYDVCPIYW